MLKKRMRRIAAYTIILLMSCLCSLSACTSSEQKENLTSLESGMIAFFQATLEKNYGDKDAVCQFARALKRYHFNYLLAVDRGKLRRINEKLYGERILKWRISPCH